MIMIKKVEGIRGLNTKKTFLSAMVISVCILLSRFTGLLRDIFFAKYLGSGIVAEAFYVAFRLPNTFRRIFAEGAFSNAFVPFFSSKTKENKKVANDFSFRVFGLLVCLLFLLTLAMEVFMPTVIKYINPGFFNDKEKFNLAVLLSRICFPYVVLISLTSFFGSMLQSIGCFAPFSLVSVILNFVIVGGLFATNSVFSNVGTCLSWILIFAGILQMFFVLFFCIKKGLLPKRYTKDLNNEEVNENKKDLKSFIRKFLSAMVSSGILQINIFVDGLFASFFVGAVSYLYYADRLVQFPMSIIGYSLSVAILPSLSIAFKEKKNEEIADLQKKSLSVALFFSLPATFLLFSLSREIVSLLFERGAFTSEDAIIVARMLAIFAFSIPFNVVNKILFACFYSQKNTATPMHISLFALIFNVVSNVILFKLVGMYCVIISTTLSAVFSFFYALFALCKVKSLFIGFENLRGYLKILFVALASCLLLPLFLCKLHVLIVLFLSGIVYLLLCFVFRILTKDFLRKVFLRKK